MSRRAARRAGNRRPRLHLEILEDRLAPSVTLGQQPGAPNNTQFHGDSLRTGFDSVETVLTPTNVASSFGQVWQSPQLDGAVYATPLYLDSLLIAGPGNAANHAGDGVQSASFQSQTLGVVFAATGGGPSTPSRRRIPTARRASPPARSSGRPTWATRTRGSTATASAS